MILYLAQCSTYSLKARDKIAFIILPLNNNKIVIILVKRIEILENTLIGMLISICLFFFFKNCLLALINSAGGNKSKN